MDKDQTLLVVEKVAIKVDAYQRPYLQVEESEGVVMLAKEGDSFILIEQFRRPVNSVVQQLPGGGVKKGEELERAGRREFFEETGYKCGTVHYLGKLQPASWRTNETTHVFFTKEVGSHHKQQLEVHENIKVVRVGIDECLKKIKENQMNDSELCYAILQAILQGYITI